MPLRAPQVHAAVGAAHQPAAEPGGGLGELGVGVGAVGQDVLEREAQPGAEVAVFGDEAVVCGEHADDGVPRVAGEGGDHGIHRSGGQRPDLGLLTGDPATPRDPGEEPEPGADPGKAHSPGRGPKGGSGQLTDEAGGPRGQPASEWLPTTDGARTLYQGLFLSLSKRFPRVRRGGDAKAVPVKRTVTPEERAARWAAMIDGEVIKTRADLARALGVSRARRRQVLGGLNHGH